MKNEKEKSVGYSEACKGCVLMNDKLECVIGHQCDKSKEATNKRK